MRRGQDERLGRLHAYMARNCWVASRAELMALGFSRAIIDSWLESGRLIRLFHGVYSLGRDVETPVSAWRAALLSAGPDAILAGRSACECWGLVRMRQGIPSRIQIASPSRKAARYRGHSAALVRTSVFISRRRIEAGDERTRDGLSVMSAPMALIDYASTTDSTSVRFAFLEACRLGHFQREDVDRCFRRIEGRRGAAGIRPLLELWVPELGRIRSVLEGLFLLAWIAQDTRMPRVNEKLCGYEVDCFWPDDGLVVELDGGGFHSDPLARRQDQAKDEALRSAGLRVARFGYQEVKASPDRVVSRVACLLGHPRPTPTHRDSVYSGQC